MRALLACAAAVGLATEVAAAGGGSGGADAAVCRADGGTECRRPQADHLMMQVRQQFRVPGQFSCGSMPAVKRSCSATGCRVLADTQGRSCAEFCSASGRTCVGAWEEQNDDCEVKYDWTCDAPLDGTSDLLCECGSEAGDGSDDGGEGATCSAMAETKRTCSANGCRVLANTQGRTCEAFCRASGRACVAAWEEQNDDCEVKFDWQCNAPLSGTSDLLCECSPSASAPVADQPGPPPIQPPAAGPPAAGGRLVWSDEFDGGSVDGSKWDFIHGGGGFGNEERQYYSQRNAVVSGGTLKITAKCEEYKHHHYTSAKLQTKHLAEWGPGHRVEVRARLPQGRGTWPAIWMLPTDSVYGQWPHSGEIDIMEAVGCTQDKVYGTVHTGRYNHMKHTEKYNQMRIPVGEWHTYTIEWEEREIRWYVDGHQYHRFAPSAYDSERWPFGQKFFLILNLAVGGSWGGFCLSGGSPSCSAWDQFGREQVMEVDFARVYAMH